MFITLRLDNEEKRLESLRRLRILDTPPEERFDRITRKACELMKVPYAMIGFVEENRVWYKSNQGFPADTEPRNQSFCGYSILHTEVFHIPDTLEDVRFSTSPWVKGPPFIRMHASSPVFATGGEAVGALIVNDTSPRILNREETKTLMLLSGWVEEELKRERESAGADVRYLRENCRHLEQQQSRLNLALRLLRRMAFVDDTTDFPNRRYFDQMLNQTFRQARHEGRSLALLMLDVDFFKDYNDTFGHLQGDACLRKVARGIQKSLRKPFDFGARYGGDEFAVIATESNETGGLRLAQRIFGQSMQEGPLFLPVARREVTFSIGVASIAPGRDDNPEELVKSADEALYAAKRTGRNCIVTAKEMRKEAWSPELPRPTECPPRRI